MTFFFPRSHVEMAVIRSRLINNMVFCFLAKSSSNGAILTTA